ncbi:MAG TPA: PAS domain-containing protein [Burkholderiales bacterium]
MVVLGVAVVEALIYMGWSPLGPVGWPGLCLILAAAIWGPSGAVGGAIVLFGYFLFTLGATHRFPHFFGNPGALSFWFVGVGVLTAAAALLRERLAQAHAQALRAAQEARELQALTEYRQWMNEILDNAPALIGYIDAEQKFAFNNRAYEHWLERPKAEITGRTVREVLGEAEYGKLKPQLERAMRGGRVTFHHEHWLRGAVRHAQTTFVPDFDRQGRVRGCFVVAKDIGDVIDAQREREGRLAEQAIERPAENDGAPDGIATQPLLLERLRRALARSQRSGAPLAVMHFTVEARDESRLAEIGARLRGCVRLTDTVARLTPGQFVVLLEGLKERSDAFRVAEKMVQALRQLEVVASVGVAFPDNGATPETLVQRAGARL